MDEKQDRQSPEGARPEESLGPQPPETEKKPEDMTKKALEMIDKARAAVTDVARKTQEACNNLWSNLKSKVPALDKAASALEENVKKIPIGAPEHSPQRAPAQSIVLYRQG